MRDADRDQALGKPTARGRLGLITPDDLKIERLEDKASKVKLGQSFTKKEIDEALARLLGA